MRQIKSLLLFNGIEIPFSGPRHWTKVFMGWLEGIDFGDAYRARSMKALIDLYGYLTMEKEKLMQDIEDLARTEKYGRRVELLTSIPGVGMLSAMEILVEL